MTKRTSLAARRQSVEMLVDVYGVELYQYVCPRLPDEERVWQLYVQIWMRAYRTLHSRLARRDHRKWLRAIADDLLVGTGAEAPLPASDEACEHGLQSTDGDRLGGVETASPSLPSALKHRVSQVLLATQAELDAERAYHGPTWVAFAVSATLLAALGLISYGVYRSPRLIGFFSNHGSTAGEVTNLAPAWRGLPTTVVAQFGLADTDTKFDVTHVGVTTDTLYLPTLSRPPQGRPSWRLNINACSLQRSGQPLESVIKHVGSLPIAPPTTVVNQTAANDWAVVDWRFQASGPWVLALVNWANAQIPNSGVNQLYAMYVPDRKSALVATFQQQTGLADVYEVAMGDGRVTLQSGFTSPSPGGQFTIVGLPIKVYRLQGSDPTNVLSSPVQLREPGGLLNQPTITGPGIVFQGFDGESEPNNRVNVNWYTLSWNGQITKWNGPPLDGQPHFAVEGRSGTAYWVETTPDRTEPGSVQVLMAPLTPAVSTAPAASTLSASVQGLAVSGPYVVWVQTNNAKPQLVVLAAN